ncbi:MAG: hypothetical protein ACTSPB_10040 [Candidatus Thorarchaeota archaeon]
MAVYSRIKRWWCRDLISELSIKQLEIARLMKENQELRERLYPPKPEKIVATMDKEAIYKILAKTYPTAGVWLLDKKYKVVEYGVLMETVKKVMKGKWRYTRELFDCDDFAFRLMGLLSIGDWAGIAFGMAFGKGHAYNIAVVEKDGVLKAVVIEPQTLAEADYKPSFVIM